MAEHILELRGISKAFSGVKALDNVQFQLRRGEIHALMGENGAGKSTLVKIITGVHLPDEGEIYVEGQRVHIRNPNDAKKLGIAAIYQHVTCYPDLTVTENIFMGHEITQKYSNKILWNEMHSEAEKLLESLGAKFDPRSQMGSLSIAQQQIVEIAKALSTNAKIIIMDEPTAALTKRECEELYRITEQLRDNGASIILISHRIEDMYRLADRVTVLRDAKYIGTWDINEISREKLIFAMVGREITQLFPKKQVEKGPEILRVEGLTKAGLFADVSFTLHRGEILGLTGLVGAGRTEVCQSIFGLLPPDKGKIYLEGKEVKIDSPWKAMELGIGYLPEDRQKQGLILQWEISKNITLPALERFSKRGWLNVKKEIKTARELAQKLNIKAKNVFALASNLSGGNQQKVVFAKLLTLDLKVIILDEPTKGVDVGAKSSIHEIISDLAQQGYGIIMISSEMPEILGMSDRIVVMREGRVTAIFDRKDATQEAILEAAMVNKDNTPIQ
nr:D-xylose ABC transporter ATP-binding protein [Clostridia bacterium]PZN09632.1 MAG: D-xylose ABC transporter ATP-binding protein [Caldicoprobacter oshimai]